MSQRDHRVRIRHMLEAAEKAVEFVTGKQRRDLDEDEQLALVPARLIEILGEAARGVPDNVRQQRSDIPWKDITGARDRLIHGYFEVDLDIVWQIVTTDIPPLIGQLKKIPA